MDYKKTYMKIIKKAKQENRKKGLGEYYESHHILPKSLFPLWAKKKSNIVLLTAREHFFCHQLLTKIYPSKEMAYAAWCFCNTRHKNKKITSREYEAIKKEYVKYFTESTRGNKNVFGKKWFNNGVEEKLLFECPEGFCIGRIPDKESRVKAGVTNKERNKTRGSVQSRMPEEKLKLWRQHLSDTHKDGKEIYDSMSEEIKRKRAKKISNSLKGKKPNDETKKKISEGILSSPKHKAAVEKVALAHKGKKFFNNGEITILATECPKGYKPGLIRKNKVKED